MYFFYIIVNHVMLSYFFYKQCEIINLKTWTWNFTVILGLSSCSMYSINYIQVWHMSGKDQERSHGILFWVMGSWHVWKKSRKTDVCSNQDISHSTDFTEETVLLMSCDESHTMTVLIDFLFLVIFFYIGLKLIWSIPPFFPRRILHAFFN